MTNPDFDNLIGSRVRLRVQGSTIVGHLKDVHHWHHDDPCFVILADGIMGELSVRTIMGGFNIDLA